MSILLFMATAFHPGVAEDDTSSRDEATDWESLMAETEELLAFTGDPLDDLELGEPSIHFWSAGLGAGAGYSHNFLKRRNAVGSRYLRTEGDLFYNRMGERDSLTLLAFFETVHYERDADADLEALVFFNLNWTRLGRTGSWGAELDGFYGDQIYDASLEDNGVTEGESLRQYRPQLSVFREWIQDSGNAMKLGAFLRRAFFEDSENDYWSPGIALDWKTAFTKSLTGETSLVLHGEFHDEEVALDENGFPLEPEDSRTVGILHLRQEVEWEPAGQDRFSMKAMAGISFEEEEKGGYNDAIRLWAGLRGEWKTGFADWKAYGRIQNTRYRHREISLLDDRLNRQTFNLLRLEAVKKLHKDLKVTIRAEWTDFRSRDESETFFERRFEALLGWTW